MTNDEIIRNLINLKPQKYLISNEYSLYYKNHIIFIYSTNNNFMYKFWFKIKGEQNSKEISKETFNLVESYYMNDTYESFLNDILNDTRKEKLEKIDKEA